MLGASLELAHRSFSSEPGNWFINVCAFTFFVITYIHCQYDTFIAPETATLEAEQ